MKTGKLAMMSIYVLKHKYGVFLDFIMGFNKNIIPLILEI